MKQSFLTKLAALAIVAFFAMNISTFAGDSYQAKIKTDVSTAVGKNKIETIVNFLKGVEDAAFDTKDRDVLIVTFDAEKTNADMIIHVLELMGYEAELKTKPINLDDKTFGNEKTFENNSN